MPENFRSAELIFFDLCPTVKGDSEVTIIESLKKGINKELPNDGTFIKQFKNRDFYKSNDFNKVTKYILLSIEENKGGQGVHFDKINYLTIEHIMPQSLTQEWKTHLGKFWKDYEYFLHTIGNLTLVSAKINCSISRRIFYAKFETVGNTGFCINNELSDKTQWKIKDIEERAEDFVQRALKIWPLIIPSPDQQKIEYRPLEKNAKLISLTIKGDEYEVKNMHSLIEITLKKIIEDKKCSTGDFVLKDTENELSVSEEQSKSYQLVDCGEFGQIFYKKPRSIENAYKFCTRLIEYAGWQPNEDWFGVAKFKENEDFIEYKFA